MKQWILSGAGLAAIVLTTACSRGPEHIQPGEWEMKTRLTQLEAPGAAPEMLAPLRSQINREQTNRTCITQETASNPLQQFREAMTRQQAGAACTTDEDRFAGGVIRVRVTCRGTNGQPGQGTMTMEGSFSETTLQATMTVSGEGPGVAGAPQSLRMTTELRGIRVGDCPGQAASGNSL